MHMPIRYGRLAMLSAVILATGTGLSVRYGHGGDPPAPPGAAGTAEGKKCLYVGAGFCARCHEEPRKSDDTDYVSLTEYNTWKTKDKHSQAYRVLTEERSRQMGKILGWKVEEDPRCLNCHAANVPTNLRRNDFKISDGVSCDACHGPASEWILPHSDKKWRTTPVAEKQQLGMRNVRDPIELSRLCMSCHVGSVSEDKVVTHEMYAAGHPPLPSIEVSTFCQAMPAHWRSLRQKPQAVQQQIRAAYKIPQDEQEQTKRTLLGAVVAFQASMELLGEPRSDALKKDRDDHWPDFANYDCYACHHELKTPSWRQKRGYTGRPGRLSLHSWPTVLLEDSLRFADDSTLAKEYHGLLLKLHQAFDVQPFGDVKELADRASQLRQWSNRLLQRLHEGRYDSAASRRLLRDLCTGKDAEKYDYNSARQKAWAIAVILKELEPADRVEKSLAELRQYLKLDLPSGTNKEILPGLPESLQTLNDYNPDRFKTALDKLRPMLSRE